MRLTTKEKLLREYVRQAIIAEDGTYFAAAEGPYGVSFGSQEDLYNTFIGPFVDVFKTAVGKTKEVTRRAGTLIRISLETILTTLIPVMGSNYKAIFDREKVALDKIKSEYKDVYERTDAALKSNDAAFLAFMAFPKYVMTGFAVKHGTAAASSVLSAFTGGYFDNLFEKTKKGLEDAGKWTDKQVTSLEKSFEKSATTKSSIDKKYKKESKGGRSDFLTEAEDVEQGSEKFDTAKLLSNKKFLNAVLGSPESRESQNRARELYKRTLSDVLAEAENVLKKMRTIEDVKKSIKDTKQMAELDKMAALPPKERQAAEQQLISGIKKSMKDFYVKNLKDHVSAVVNSGIPESSPYVKDYKETMQKIQSM